MRYVTRLALGVLAVATLAVAPSAAGEDDPNRCDQAGERPDVIVGDIPEIGNYGNVGDIYAFSVGTTSCNIGSCELNWFSNTPNHPVIAQNMYRLEDGRLEQIGQSWLKHGFFALSLDLCSEGCIETNGNTLGVNCSDPYTSGLNGFQGGLGPRSEVDASSGEFRYPFGTIGEFGDRTYKRLQAHRDDLDPARHPEARFFVEGHYVARDDALARNDHNNASWREIVISPTSLFASLTGQTVRESPAIRIWKTHYPDVVEENVDIQLDGRIVMAGRSWLNPDGTRHYEYAIQNVNSDRSVRRFEVPVPAGATVTNIGFDDVDYHSGEPYDGTDWPGRHEPLSGLVVWETATFQQDPFANALRWGTLYNFRFDIDTRETGVSRTSIELFKPAAAAAIPGDHFALLPAPEPCNSNGVCEAAESCVNCSADCPGDMPPCDDAFFDRPERLAPGAVQLEWHGLHSGAGTRGVHGKTKDGRQDD